MSSNQVYISRNFTEFGPFTQEEVLDFSKRSIIGKKDFVRVGSSDTWIHADEWSKQADAGTSKVSGGGDKAAPPNASPTKAAASAPAKKAAKKATAKKAAR